MNYRRTYGLKWKTCSSSYIGQTGISTGVRHREHTRYITTNQFRHTHYIFQITDMNMETQTKPWNY
jgi:hypothetical protein